MSTHKFAQKALSSRDIPLSVTHTLKADSFFQLQFIEYIGRVITKGDKWTTCGKFGSKKTYAIIAVLNVHNCGNSWLSVLSIRFYGDLNN